MSDDIVGLKAELQMLSGRIQAERNDEVRHGLQRGRLEAERAQLLVKLIEAMAPAAASMAAPAVARPGAYNITLSSGLTCPKAQEAPIPVTLRPPDTPPRKRPGPRPRAGKHKRSLKPANLPTTEELVFAVLEGKGWMRPTDIASAIRDRFWPDASLPAVSPVIWRLGKASRLERSERGYRLPPHTVAESSVEQARKSNGQFGV